MRNPSDRLNHDVLTAVRAVISERLGDDQIEIAKALWKCDGQIVNAIVKELRIRWTIIERPRKQTTLRQEA